MCIKIIIPFIVLSFSTFLHKIVLNVSFSQNFTILFFDSQDENQKKKKVKLNTNYLFKKK